MSANNSNAPQRNRAILKATLLVLLLMLLAGVGGSFFSNADGLDAFDKGNFTANKMARLEQLEKDCQNLLAWFDKAERINTIIKQKDAGWETSSDQAGLKSEIRGLEDELSDLVNTLKKESNDTLLTPRAVNAYAGIISTRGEVWKWRGKSTLPPPPPPGDPLANLKQKAWIIASDLDKKASDIEKVIPQIKRDKNDKSELERYVSDLKNLANQLRGI